MAKSLEINRTRKFNGKVYRGGGWFLTKAMAQETARWHKKHGDLVRVVLTSPRGAEVFYREQGRK